MLPASFRPFTVDPTIVSPLADGPDILVMSDLDASVPVVPTSRKDGTLARLASRGIALLLAYRTKRVEA